MKEQASTSSLCNITGQAIAVCVHNDRKVVEGAALALSKECQKYCGCRCAGLGVNVEKLWLTRNHVIIALAPPCRALTAGPPDLFAGAAWCARV